MAKCVLRECNYPRQKDSWTCAYHTTEANTSTTRESKYNAQRTETQGKTFASKAEAARYQELVLLQQAGVIRNLECQRRWPLIVNGIPVGHYVSDFEYDERQGDTWPHVTEDTKGVKTPVFLLKSKLMLALYGVSIRLTTKTQSK